LQLVSVLNPKNSVRNNCFVYTASRAKALRVITDTAAPSRIQINSRTEQDDHALRTTNDRLWTARRSPYSFEKDSTSIIRLSMRTYWIRIALGALGVFAVGMALIFVARKVIAKVRTVAETSDPITLPLAFVPFRLDGSRLGTFDRAVLIRKSPKEVSALNLSVKLVDSASAARLAGCALLARFTPRPKGGGSEFTDADFACVKPDSAAAAGAELFGEVAFEPGGLTLPLFVPADVASHFRRDMVDIQVDVSADSITRAADSIADAAGRVGDSMGEAASRMADSISALHEHRADSIREAALRMADSMRRRARLLRDSIRSAVRRP